MFLRYKSFGDRSGVNWDLKYLLRQSICLLWFGLKEDFEQRNTSYEDFVRHNILTAIWLKYRNNRRVMKDFWKIFGTENETESLFRLCTKYGRTISLAHIITAYNICLMFVFQEENRNIIYKVLWESKLNKDFVRNATIDVKDFIFDDFVIKYNVKNKLLQTDYGFYDKNVKKFLKESLVDVKKLSFTNCDQAGTIMPYFNGKCVTKIAKIAFNKPLGLQILYASVTIGNVLSYYFNEYKQYSGDTNAKNLVETDYKRFVNNIEKILNRLVEYDIFANINNYLKLVNKSVNSALRQVFDVGIYNHCNQLFSLQTPYETPYTGLRYQKDGTAPITRIRKLCKLLDTKVVNQLVNTPYDKWQQVLAYNEDKFDKTMNNFYNTIINCGILMNRDNNKTKRSISFDKTIAPKYFQIRKTFDGFSTIPNNYYIPLGLNFYKYFSTIDSTETDNMLKLREKCVKELETCLTNMLPILDYEKLKEYIKVKYEK